MSSSVCVEVSLAKDWLRRRGVSARQQSWSDATQILLAPHANSLAIRGEEGDNIIPVIFSTNQTEPETIQIHYVDRQLEPKTKL